MKEKSKEEITLKEFLVVYDYEEFMIWSKTQYEIYVHRACVVGATPVVKVITTFNKDDSFFAQQPNAFEKFEQQATEENISWDHIIQKFCQTRSFDKDEVSHIIIPLVNWLSKNYSLPGNGPLETDTNAVVSVDLKDIAAHAWKNAANAYRMYPDSKHTFADYWDSLGKDLVNQQLQLKPTGKEPVKSAEGKTEDWKERFLGWLKNDPHIKFAEVYVSEFWSEQPKTVKAKLALAYRAGFFAMEAYRNQDDDRLQKAIKPKVVCLCGSTRFAEYFMTKRWELEKQGVITLGINILPNNYFVEGDSHGAEQEGVKEVLDELHKRKIDLSDEVFVLNVNGYIGESTRSEIEYAEKIGKPIQYLQSLTTQNKPV